MRVVAGSWRGRKLQAPKGEAVRPTTDRVKEALFNILGPAVADAVVLDLCCGSGGLGIEALSRGARRTVFVDRDTRSLDCARRNLEACGAEPADFELVRAEAVGWLTAWLAQPGRPARWLLLADPPYHSHAGRAILEVLDGADTDGLLRTVIEHRTGEELPDPTPGRWTWQRRNYGESELMILEPA